MRRFSIFCAYLVGACTTSCTGTISTESTPPDVPDSGANDGGSTFDTGAGGSADAGAGVDAGAAADAATADDAGATPDAGGPIVATGRSVGCGRAPAAEDSANSTALKEVRVGSTLDPIYLAGGAIYADHDLPKPGGYDFETRPYGLRLPRDYDPSVAYPVVIGGNGCGGNIEDFASNPNTGYQPGDGNGEAIQVGLMYLGQCFSDGGPRIQNRTDTPEVDYVSAVLDAVEEAYCVDRSRVFLSGTSSGGWESYTVGCALSDRIRAIGPVAGGWRQHHPACAGPLPAIMVVGLGDTANPIGPIEPPAEHLDSAGSAPGRDDLLVRNGCVDPGFAFEHDDVYGNAPHEVWDEAYPLCARYTGCPDAFPVVWCPLNGGHQADREGDVSYKDGIWEFFDRLGSL